MYSLAGISLLGDEEFDQEEEKNACEETDKPDEGQQNANIQTDIPQFPENMSQSTPTQDFRFSTMHCCVNLSLHFDYGRVDELYSSNHLSKCRFFFPTPLAGPLKLWLLQLEILLNWSHAQLSEIVTFHFLNVVNLEVSGSLFWGMTLRQS